jgi:predicted RNA-binding Zn-ribbon protein involved in translation (DUF1610 family)
MTSDNHPFDFVLDEANKLLENPNVNLYQKFTCIGCGNRLTMEEPNTFYTSGTCDKCGTLTDIRKEGCNYLVVARIGVA